MALSNPQIDKLIADEGWRIVKQKNDKGEIALFIEVYGELYPYTHPCAIHLKLYRTSKEAGQKYKHMKAAHDYLWPEQIKVWTHWDEIKFRTHCEDWEMITYAGGANCSKSFTAAKIAVIFWLANPKHRAVLVMSTTLESLNSRIYGYVCRLLSEIKVPFEYRMYGGNQPRIMLPQKLTKGRKDYLHSISAVAAKRGDSDTAISGLIGRHPDEGMMIVADEATDLPTVLLSAVPNLFAKIETKQLVAIGNSNLKFDLHGALSTPKDGWGSVDPMKVSKWETTQEKGVCLFFNPYDSPAITCVDPAVRARVEKFYITAAQIEAKKKLYGEQSDSFYRFVLGYWRDEVAEDAVVSRKFINEFRVTERGEWSGLADVRVCAGLDPAFSTGGDDCVLRLGLLGQCVDGRIMLDFRGEQLIFKIPISAGVGKSAELQIADAVLAILGQYRVGLGDLVVDATGQGRALAEVIKLRAGSAVSPIKIFSTRMGGTGGLSQGLVASGGGKGGQARGGAYDERIMSNLELWNNIRRFIETDQLRGLDESTIQQLTSRLILKKGDKVVLESKRDYKLRMGSISPLLAVSPDRADACSLCLMSAILRYGFVPGQRTEMVRKVEWQDNKMAEFARLCGGGGAVQEEHNKGRPAAPIATFTTSLEDSGDFGSIGSGFRSGGNYD